ncbi:oxidoreductase [Pseudomonas sp. 21TX0197]|jgi:NAD(P)-dependent dehydrogenase (short-subunit alcohol dehydrogenase family)|uniref:oxidoreductase n=1 Tax=Pseudomonas TaxID=286 RepID=UPI0009089A63|nr:MULTISPECIES: oxidoreductase [Pseudomonas]MDB6443741.1 oxidoreductase [Pseudomonas sp. 21TX0197]MDT8904870.1 oxidoreductase [Pseudomonas prosekii]NHN68700.1 SDR family NAD(P)-dependent oxidoreductase [Pseudomonas fluorescens]ROO31509.1 short-chain dehydrogenase/reductase [Pseudomonas sp. 7SR1]ROO38007.1 short-chain dehydrogenase/reductase [Pseudomonas sp. AF76]
MSKQHSWLVTGCSTGFGRFIATHLLERGERVIVTARNAEQVRDLADLGEALILPLDVTDAEQAKAVVAQAERLFGSVDVLVNNAGIGYFAAVEETDPQSARRLFEVNFFGSANMIHAVLPGMRQRGRGMIVNLTSIGGLAGFPAVGYYCASKFALEGLSETLRAEVEPLGIGVMTVEPSAFRTEWAGSATQVSESIADYDATAGQARRAYDASIGRQEGDPARAAAAIYSAVTAAQPPQRLLLGNRAVDVAMGKLSAMQTEFRTWERVSRGADFPLPEA